MKTLFFRYLKSFYPTRVVGFTFGWDIIAASLIAIFVFLFNKILEWRLYVLTGGKDLATFKATILSGSVEVSKQFLSDSRTFTVVYFGGIVIVILLALLIAALSQHSVWSLLLKRKITFTKRIVFQWLKLFTVFPLFVLAAILTYLIFIQLVNALLPKNLTAAALIMGIFNSFYLLLFFIWSFLVLFHFCSKEKISESIGASFHWMKKNKKKFLLLLLFSMATLIIVNLLYQKMMPLRFVLDPSNPYTILIKLVIILGFYNWLRWYVFQEVRVSP